MTPQCGLDQPVRYMKEHMADAEGASADALVWVRSTTENWRLKPWSVKPFPSPSILSFADTSSIQHLSWGVGLSGMTRRSCYSLQPIMSPTMGKGTCISAQFS